MMDIGRTIKLMDTDSTHIQMEHNMKAIGWTISNKDKEKNIGQMVLNMKEIGQKANSKDMEGFCILIKIFMKENSKLVWPVEKVFIQKCLVRCMMVTGLKINSMVKVSIHFPMVLDITVITVMEIKMVMVFTLFQISQFIKDIGKITNSKVMEHTTGQMAANTVVNGVKT